jgi:hypothetical protein
MIATSIPGAQESTREGKAVKFEMFHLMPYRELPADFAEAHRSVWVDIPVAPRAGGPEATRTSNIFRVVADDVASE